MNLDEFDHRTMAYMDIVLEDTCRALKHGGDHESRKFVAERLMACARDGHTTPDELRSAACAALLELTGQNTARSITFSSEVATGSREEKASKQ